MSTKDKAKDLVNKFGKKYACMCVDEIIKGIDGLQYNRKTDYWENVKQEIESHE